MRISLSFFFVILHLNSISLCNPLLFPQTELPGILGNGGDSTIATQTQLAHLEHPPTSSRLVDTVFHAITSYEHKLAAPTTSTPTRSTTASLAASTYSTAFASTQSFSLSSSSSTSTGPQARETVVQNDQVSKAAGGSKKEWKVVAMSLFAIGGIVGVVVVFTFVKTVWRYFREKSTRRGSNNEGDTIDWDPIWQHKLASEDGHRYPASRTVETSQVYAEPAYDYHTGILPGPPRFNAFLSPPAPAAIEPYHRTPLCRQPSMASTRLAYDGYGTPASRF